MRLFLKFSLILAAILIPASVLIPRAYGISFPRQPGPATDRQVRTHHIEYMDEHQPQIVLIGDSTLVLGMDPDLLAERTGRSVYRIGIPGSASALWYLLLKNNIAETTHKPEYVLVVFRDSILTAPGYRVHGSYFELVDEYAGSNEPVFIEKSFINQMNPLEIMADKYFPLYVARTDIRNAIDARIRYFSPPLLGCDRDCTDHALGELFAGADFEPQALVDAVNAAESLLYTPRQLDFEARVERSFLPDMIDIAKENGIHLVFVRIKVESGNDSPELNKYLVDLRKYLAEKDASLLDFGDDPRLTPEHFRDSIHLNETGREIFTNLVADGMREIWGER